MYIVQAFFMRFPLGNEADTALKVKNIYVEIILFNDQKIFFFF